AGNAPGAGDRDRPDLRADTGASRPDRLRGADSRHAADAPALRPLLSAQAESLGGGNRRAGHQLLGLRGRDLSRRLAGNSPGPDGSRAGLGNVALDGPAAGDHSPGGANRDPSGHQRLHRFVQGHLRLLGHHPYRADQGVLDPRQRLRRSDRVRSGRVIPVYDDESTSVLVLAVVREAAGGPGRERGGGGMSMIEVNDLVKWHGSIEVLKGVNLSVRRGEVATIIGPSGSGKSTLLRCLNGLETFQGGSVTIDGLRVGAHDGAAERARVQRQVCLRVGMVFQSFNLFPHRTVLQNVIEGPVYVLGIHPEQAAQRARRLLARVGMSERLDAIPRALAMEPQVILFDEPTSALDPRMTTEVLAVMTDLAGDGLTMVVVTHAMHFARRVAHTVHVFGEGRIIESGPPAQIFDDPSQEATRTLLSEVVAA